MRLVFAGTPQVAVASLDALVDSGHEVVGVLTRPPARAGRGREPQPSPVQVRAEELGIAVMPTRDLGDADVLERLRAWQPDCCPVVAYGVMIRPPALAVPPLGWVNVHFSLLPRWRGAAPVQRAIWAGDAVTGVTVFRIDEGLDTGPVLSSVESPLGPAETSGEVLERLAVTGADLLVTTLDALTAGTCREQVQPSSGVTLAPRIDPEDARVTWASPADAIDRQVRACTPAPGAWTTLRGQRLRLGPVTTVVDEGSGDREAAAGMPALAPGEISASKHEVRVGTATVPVLLGEVIAEGRRPMGAADWARGLRLELGESFA